MGKITPFLWFDHDAREAMDLYCSLFEDAKVLSVTRYQEGSPFPPGTRITARFELAGQEFIALNGGPAPPSAPARPDARDQAASNDSVPGVAPGAR